METYTDKAGKEIKIGDALIYDEGPGYGKSIDEVIEHEGELAAIMRVGEPKWTVLKDQKPMPLKFYKVFAESSKNVTTHATVADVEPPKAFTADYAASVFDA